MKLLCLQCASTNQFTGEVMEDGSLKLQCGCGSKHVVNKAILSQNEVVHFVVSSKGTRFIDVRDLEELECFKNEVGEFSKSARYLNPKILLDVQEAALRIRGGEKVYAAIMKDGNSVRELKLVNTLDELTVLFPCRKSDRKVWIFPVNALTRLEDLEAKLTLMETH